MNNYVVLLIIVICVLFYCVKCSTVDRMTPRRRDGVAVMTFNKKNASWNRFGYNNPTLSQSFKSNDQLYNAYETYWKGVDRGLFKIPTDPNVYYALSS